MLLSVITVLYCSKASAVDTIEIELVIKDHVFYPNVIEVEPGKKIKLVIYNEDETMEEFESLDLKREKIIPPKSYTNVILAPLKIGTYYFFGEFHEDTANGYIIVKE